MKMTPMTGQDVPETPRQASERQKEFVDAALETEVSWEVANLNLTVGDVVTVARWLAPIAAALAARPAATVARVEALCGRAERIAGSRVNEATIRVTNLRAALTPEATT